MTTTQVLILPLLCRMTYAAAGQPPEEPANTIRLGVNLVVINVNVVNKDGETVSGLGKQAFQVFEDGLPRAITIFRGEDAPVTVGVVVDNSASMGPKRSEVIAAALAFARSSNPQDQMFVVHFNDRAKLGLPPEKPFTDNISELEKALSHFVAAGTTALYDAMGMALSHIGRAVIDRKILVMVSDGGDNSSRSELSDILQWAQESGVVFYCIGLFDDRDTDRNPRLLSQLALLTGGKAFFPADVKDTTRICVEVAHEIRSQYTIGFAGSEDGKYHRISVIAQEPRFGELHVSTRPGYWGAKP